MKKRVFTIGIFITVPLFIILILGGIILFSSPPDVLEKHFTHEKQLGKLFEKYRETHTSMTETQLIAWEKDVEQLGKKLKQSFDVIQNDESLSNELLKAKVSMLKLPEPKYTGIAAISFKDISSDDFDVWLVARDKAKDERHREWLRNTTDYSEKEIEAAVARVNDKLANDPKRQEHREKMRKHILRREASAERRLERAREKREAAAYKAKRDQDKAWLAAEAARLANEEWDISDTDISDMPPAEYTDAIALPGDDVPPSKGDDLPTRQPISSTPSSMQPAPRDTFNPAAVSDRLSKDMSRWEDDLVESYPELFRFKDSEDQSEFEQSLPPDAREHFKTRQKRMQHEYVRRVQTFLSDTSTEQRAETLRIVRETLEKNWNRDFAESVLNQLTFDEK